MSKGRGGTSSNSKGKGKLITYERDIVCLPKWFGRSVFRGPMDGDELFQFRILQSSGGDSRRLMIPVLSSSYKWTSHAVAGRNAKVPIYILAEDRLEVIVFIVILYSASTMTNF